MKKRAFTKLQLKKDTLKMLQLARGGAFTNNCSVTNCAGMECGTGNSIGEILCHAQ